MTNYLDLTTIPQYSLQNYNKKSKFLRVTSPCKELEKPQQKNL